MYTSFVIIRCSIRAILLTILWRRRHALVALTLGAIEAIYSTYDQGFDPEFIKRTYGSLDLLVKRMDKDIDSSEYQENL